jgi:hypothetical protein
LEIKVALTHRTQNLSRARTALQAIGSFPQRRKGKGGGGRGRGGGRGGGNGLKPCFKFQKGKCDRGDSCKFSHDPSDASVGRSGGRGDSSSGGGERESQPGIDGVATGKKAAKELLSALADGGCVDSWLQDQLILFMALATGTSEMCVAAPVASSCVGTHISAFP